jgi:hypothetical protein
MIMVYIWVITHLNFFNSPVLYPESNLVFIPFQYQESFVRKT